MITYYTIWYDCQKGGFIESYPFSLHWEFFLINFDLFWEAISEKLPQIRDTEPLVMGKFDK
jgi:hypothetical protein